MLPTKAEVRCPASTLQGNANPSDTGCLGVQLTGALAMSDSNSSDRAKVQQRSAMQRKIPFAVVVVSTGEQEGRDPCSASDSSKVTRTGRKAGATGGKSSSGEDEDKVTDAYAAQDSDGKNAKPESVEDRAFRQRIILVGTAGRLPEWNEREPVAAAVLSSEGEEEGEEGEH